MQAAATTTLWHRRMGYLNRKSLDLLKKVNNNRVSFDGTVPDCDVCAPGKSRQRAHSKTADQHVQRPFQLVFTDLMGQFTPEALGGYKYVSKISDEHTRGTEIHFLKSKDGAFHAFQSFVQSIVIPSGVCVERLRADKGGEFIGNNFEDYCTRMGVLLEYASTNTPQQIGMSERVGGTLATMVRFMLADSGLPTFLWREMMLTAAYVRNRAPHSALNMQSPYKMLKGTEPDLRILRVIGAMAFCAHRETYQKARAQGSGRAIGWVQQQQQELSRVQSGHQMHHGKQERHLFRDAIAPTSVTFRGASIFNAMQELPPGDDLDRDIKGHNYITDDDF